MVEPWVVYSIGSYVLIASALMFIMWPYAEIDHVPRSKIVRDSLGWPFWALLLMIEAAEEGRRYWNNRRVE